MNNAPRTAGQTAVIDIFRNLWQQYFIWMTNLFINIVCGFGNITFITERIDEKLQEHVLEFQKYYGFQPAKNFELLLDNYLKIEVKLLTAFKEGDMQAASAARSEALKNADEIAELFSKINPYWDKEEWKNLIYEHLRLIENQFIYRLDNVCVTEITEDQNVKNHILKISDYMAEGIIQQFRI